MSTQGRMVAVVPTSLHSPLLWKTYLLKPLSTDTLKHCSYSHSAKIDNIVTSSPWNDDDPKMCLYVCVCVLKDQKLREVLGFGKGDNVEGKLVTIVYGNDLVNISFLNFQAMQEDTAKVTVETATSTP